MSAILFDLDETLVLEEESVKDAFLVALEPARARYGIDPEELHATVRRCAREIWHSSPMRPWCLQIGVSSWEGLTALFVGGSPEIVALRKWAPEYRAAAWRRSLAAHGIEDNAFVEELARRYIAERDQRHVPFPEVESVLTRLKESHRLGILTNGLPRHQRRKLEGAGLDRYFESVTVSGDPGVGKPGREIFEAALDAIGAGADETWMVGDNFEKDIAGAHAVGMKTAWVNRGGRARPDEIVPDAEVRDLTGLEAFLA